MPIDRFDVPGVAEGDEEAEGPLAEPPIEPGEPTAENALFVLLGVLVALAVVARLFVLFG